jgi:hypothetical protein
VHCKVNDTLVSQAAGRESSPIIARCAYLYLRVRRTWEKTSRIFDSRALTLAYKGGEKGVIVPENVPVVMVEPADRPLLVPGAHVVVYAAAQPDGTLAAERLTVGKTGFVPPPL